MNIREAQVDDLQSIIALGLIMHKTSNFRNLQFDGRFFGERLVNLMADPHGLVIVAEDPEDGLVGGLLASIGPYVASPDLVAYELAFYLSPKHRGSGVARQILSRYRQWAVRKGARRIMAGNSAGANDEGYVKLLESSGFERAGSLMFIDLTLGG